MAENSFGSGSNPSFGRIKKLSLSVGEGKEEKSLPLASMTCVWSLDAGSFCTVVPVVGKKLLPTQGESNQVDAFLEQVSPSKPANIYLQDDSMGKPAKIHTGFPIVSHVESAAGSTMNSGILARSVGVNSRLDLLSAVSPATRVFFSKAISPKASKVADLEVAAVSDGSKTAYFVAGKPIVVVNPAEYIIDLMDRLQKAFRDAGDQKVEDIQSVKKILVTKSTYNLTDVITGGDKALMGALLSDQAAARANNWVNTSIYGALNDFNQQMFLHTVPENIEQGTFRLGPTLALGRDYVRSLKLSEILSASRDKSSFDDMIPITQVWVSRIWGGSNDATTVSGLSENFDKLRYHRYPDDKDVAELGNALIKQPPPFFSVICEQKLANGGTGSKKTLVKQVGVKTDESRSKNKSAQTKEEKAKENPGGRDQSKIDTLGQQFAKMYYVERAYAKQTATVNIPWHLYEEMVRYIGQNIRFTIPFEQGSFVGNLVQVSLTIDRPSVKATCVLHFSHVRTEADNTKLGFTEHPIYNDWIGKKSNIYDDASLGTPPGSRTG